MISAFEKFVYRIPFLPYQQGASPRTLEEMDDYLIHFLRRDSFREALFIASPDFFQEAETFLREPAAFNPRRLAKFRETTMKYIMRMTTRATPFGLFSGCGTGVFSDKTALVPDGYQPFDRHVRLDMGLLSSFAEYMLADRELRKALLYFPNNTLYRNGEQLRYIEYRYDEEGRSYNLASATTNEYVEKILDKVLEGSTIEQLSNALLDDDITYEEAEDFVQEMIDAQLLISELEPQITGVDYNSQLMGILKDKLTAGGWPEQVTAFLTKSAALLQEIADKCKEILAASTYSESAYKDIIELAQQLDLRYPVKHYIQVDCSVRDTLAGSLNKSILNEVVKGTKNYLKLCLYSSSNIMQRFRTKFADAYEGRFVKLSEALDPEMGIGYGLISNDLLDITPFVDDIPIAGRGSSENMELHWRSKLHTLLLRRVIAGKGAEIELTDKELEELNYDEEGVPATFNAFVSVYFDKEGKHLINFHHVGASTATGLMGRFGRIGEFGSLIKDICAYEEAYFDDCAVAEINHLPDSRTGNIMLREAFRSFEISYFSKPGKPAYSKIGLDDLYIGIKDNRLILYARSLGKEVVPRLSNAQNFNKDPLPIYRFLCDYQDNRGNGYLTMVMDVGPLAQLLEHIPRIRYRNFIYWPATWYIQVEEIKRLFALPQEELRNKVLAFLNAKGVPACFCLSYGEGDLLIDTSNPFMVDFFISEIRDMQRVTLKESLLAAATSTVVANEKGHYAHELIIPFKKEKKPGRSATPRSEFPDAYFSKGVKRSFCPGEEWVYLKVYAGVKTCSKIVTTVLPSLIEELKNEAIIREWFFIRYNDPSFHLRIRLRLRDRSYYNTTIQRLQDALAPFVEAETVKSLVMDTYTRELERYGFGLIVPAEQIFAIDSEACLALLQQLAEEGLSGYAWLAALSVIDMYLGVFGLNDKEKYNFSKQMRDNFSAEFNGNKQQRRHIVARYRLQKSMIDGYWRDHRINDIDVSFIMRILEEYQVKLSAIYETSYADVPLEERQNYVGSFLHMFIVRFFSSKNRLHEYLLYGLMEQHYRYLIGRNEYQQHEMV